IFGLLFFVDYLARDLGRGQRVILLLITLSVPLAMTAAHEFRPDFAAALFTAMGIVLGLESAAALLEGDVQIRRIILAGLFFGAALLAKPSFFPHSVVLSFVPAGFIFLGWWVNRTLRSRGASLLLRTEGCYFAGVVLPALPFFLWDGRHI